MKKLSVLLVLTLLFSCAKTPKDNKYRGYETAEYKVIKKIDNVEYREYQPYIVAEVEVAGDRQEAAKKGFRILASYIFGKNIADEKIAMTSPVAQKEKAETIAMTSPVNQIEKGKEKWIVQFKMPNKYSLKTLPRAKDDRIKFKEVAKRKTISITFSGHWSDEKFLQHKKLLEEFIEKNNVKAKSAAIFAYYDDPFTFPWNHRNEVIYEVK